MVLMTCGVFEQVLTHNGNLEAARTAEDNMRVVGEMFS